MQVQTQSIDDAVKSMLGQSAAPAQAPATGAEGGAGAPQEGQAAGAAPAANPAANPNEVNNNPTTSSGSDVAKGIFQSVNAKQQENSDGATQPEGGAKPTEPVQAKGADTNGGEPGAADPDAAIAKLAEQSEADPAKPADGEGGDGGEGAASGASNGPTDEDDPFAGDGAGTDGDDKGAGSEGGGTEEPNAFDDPESGGEGGKGEPSGDGSGSSEPTGGEGAGSSTEPGSDDNAAGGSTDTADKGTDSGSKEGTAGADPEAGGQENPGKEGSQEGTDEGDGEDSSKDSGKEGGSEEVEKSSDEIADEIKKERSEDSSQTQDNREMIEEAVSISRRLVEIAEQVADRHPESSGKEDDKPTKSEADEAATESIMRMGRVGLESLARQAEKVLGYKIDLLSEDPAQEALYITTEQTRAKLGELYRKVSTELPEQREAWGSMRGSLDQLKLQEGKPLETASLASLLTIDGQITDAVFNVGEIILSLAADHSAWVKSELAAVVMAAHQGKTYEFKTPEYRAMVKADHQMQDSYSRAGLIVAGATEKLAGDIVFLLGHEVNGPDMDTLRCEHFGSAEQEGAKVNSLSKEALIALDNTIKLNEMVLTKLLKYSGEVLQVLDGLSPALAKMNPDDLVRSTMARAIAVFCSGPRELLRYMSSYHTAIMLLAKESFTVLAAEPEPQAQPEQAA